jgi:aminotransferase
LETLDASFYGRLATDYRARRDILHGALLQSGFGCFPPEGAYYILADFSRVEVPSAARGLADTEFAIWLSREIGVTPVPGSSFYRDAAEEGRKLVRFVFCKTDDVLHEAARRLASLSSSTTQRSERPFEPAQRSGLQR